VCVWERERCDSVCVSERDINELKLYLLFSSVYAYVSVWVREREMCLCMCESEKPWGGEHTVATVHCTRLCQSVRERERRVRRGCISRSPVYSPMLVCVCERERTRESMYTYLVCERERLREREMSEMKLNFSWSSVYAYVSMCLRLCERERERERDEWDEAVFLVIQRVRLC